MRKLNIINEEKKSNKLKRMRVGIKDQTIK